MVEFINTEVCMLSFFTGLFLGALVSDGVKRLGSRIIEAIGDRIAPDDK